MQLDSFKKLDIREFRKYADTMRGTIVLTHHSNFSDIDKTLKCFGTVVPSMSENFSHKKMKDSEKKEQTK